MTIKKAMQQSLLKNKVYCLLSFLFYLSYQSSNAQIQSCELRLKKALAPPFEWRYNLCNNHNDASKSLLNQLNTTLFNCIAGNDTAYISKYFGNHYIMSNDFTMEYELSSPCNLNIIYKRCDFLDFILDEHKKVVSVNHKIVDLGFPHRKIIKHNIEQLQKSLTQAWSFNLDSGYYLAKTSNVKKIDSLYGGWIATKDTGFVSRMFGKNYTISPDINWMAVDKYPSVMKYYLSPPTNDTIINATCKILIFYFDRNFKIVI